MRKGTDHGCQDFSLNIRFHFTLYLKCQLSLIIYYILYNAELSTEQSDELQKYCQIRYGVSLPNCKNVLFKRMIDNGFYKPE